MSAPATEVTIYQNRPLVLTLRFIKRNGARFDLTGSYEARFFRLNNTTPFATANGANGQLTLSTEEGGLLPNLMSLSMTAANMAMIEGYGSVEIVETVTGLPLCVLPTRMVKEGTAWTPEYGASLTIWGEQVVVTAEITQHRIDEVTGILTAAAQTLAAGSPATAAVQVQAGHVHLVIGVPSGPAGDPGGINATLKNLAMNILPFPSLVGRRAMLLSLSAGGYCDFDAEGSSAGGDIKDIAQANWGSSTGSWQPSESGGLVQRAANSPPIAFDAINAVSGIRSQLAATNLILSSAAPPTQVVAVTAQPYTLHFVGAGSITLSGAATGVLTGAGTGEAKRVKMTFTPGAGTLTLTMSGSVTLAQLEAGSIATSYIPTTGAPASRAADVCSIPLAMTSAGWTLTGGFVAPPQGALSRLLAVYINDTNYHILHVGSTGIVGAVGAQGGADIGNAITAAALVPGEHYRVAASWDALNGYINVRLRSRSGTLLTGQTALLQQLAVKAASKLFVGHWSGGGQPRTLITSAAVMPRSIPASMLAEYVP